MINLPATNFLQVYFRMEAPRNSGRKLQVCAWANRPVSRDCSTVDYADIGYFGDGVMV